MHALLWLNRKADNDVLCFNITVFLIIVSFTNTCFFITFCKTLKLYDYVLNTIIGTAFFNYVYACTINLWIILNATCNP